MKNFHQSYQNQIKRSVGERVFDGFNIIFMILMSVVMLYPFWYILIYSFNKGEDAARGGIWFWPRAFTTANYAYVLSYPDLHTAALVTVARCLAGPLLSVAICLMAAFALSKRFLPGRRAIIFFLMGPMFIGGTVVSNYIVIAKMHLLNNFLVYILPGAFGYFTAVIMRSFIDGLPNDLQDSAMLDGAGYWTVFWRIIVPLTKPCIAAFLFFSVVSNWLDLQANLLYVTKRSLYTLQYIMYMVISSTEANNIINVNSTNAGAIITQLNQSHSIPTPQVVQMAIMVVVTFPILLVYPFFQKYFVKGMLTGAVKE